jgi:transcription elongation factor GreA
LLGGSVVQDRPEQDGFDGWCVGKRSAKKRQKRQGTDRQEMDKIPMTREGFERLEAELRNLKSVERPAVIRAIAEARDHGDLSENAEYHAARERQSFIEGRIGELEDKVSRGEIIDVASLTGKQIKFGAKVTLADVDTNEESTYQIVGADEADVEKGRISITSPLSRALINKQAGDTVEVTTPRGSKAYEIMKVRFK